MHAQGKVWIKCILNQYITLENLHLVIIYQPAIYVIAYFLNVYQLTRLLSFRDAYNLPPEHKPLPKEPDSREERKKVKTPKGKTLI